MMLRKLTALSNKVTFTIEVEEEGFPVHGNAMNSDDEALNRETEEYIIRQLKGGNIWAWCSIKVTATYKQWSASQYLECCSYESKADFKQDDCYVDMRNRALYQLNEKLAEIWFDLPKE